MANKSLKIKQYRRIVELISKEENISLDDSLEIFYKSKSYECLDLEIGDYHCQGDLYIVEDIINEYHNKTVFKIIDNN